MVKSHANTVNGYWLGEQAAKLGLRREFEYNRDPLMAAQLNDLSKSEAERRRATSPPSPAAKVETRTIDKPAPALKPPAHMRGRSQALPSLSPSPGGLRAQRDAAFAAADRTQEQARQSLEPHASPDRAPAQNEGLSRTYNATSHTPSQSP